MTSEELKTQALASLHAKQLPQSYEERLRFEFAEIEKQGAYTYWINLIDGSSKQFANPNGLLLPWLLGLTPDDPVPAQGDRLINSTKFKDVKDYIERHGRLPVGVIRDADMPDVDLDCVPYARGPLKEYASSRYSITDDEYGSVCSVATWQTYLLRSALSDVAKALGSCDQSEVLALTKSLPDDVDQMKDGGYSVCLGKIITNGIESECKTQHKQARCPKCQSEATQDPTIGRLLEEHELMLEFSIRYPDVMEHAINLVGRVRTMGMHSGALIITDRPLYGNIPMAKNQKTGYWVSTWTEGRSTQLSKLGYNKWDILGLKNLLYIENCCRFIQENRGIYFGTPTTDVDDQGRPKLVMDGWDDIDPTENRVGFYYQNGVRHEIPLDDRAALAMANASKTDGVFQFDTELAKSILANGVTSFDDLLLLNACGHPGPMDSIPEIVANRDSNDRSWYNRLHPIMQEIVGDTYGYLVYQEQLAAAWQRIAGFTSPEAQDARKAVAKKWKDKLLLIEAKWMDGASKVLGEAEARVWWDKMVSFARYAFNKSHAVQYCLVAYRCLWLKSHFPAEWWAAVMSDCHPDKLVRYMDVARSEGVKFDTLNINHLTTNFTVTGEVVNQGMIGIKGIGRKAAARFGGVGDYQDIDQFVAAKGKSQTVLERMIKLGAFKHLHPNIKATWEWYRYKYGSNRGASANKRELKTKILATIGFDQRGIEEERRRQVHEYKTLYPRRVKIPRKILNWMPDPEQYVTRERLMALFSDDYALREILAFEKAFLGYYLHSPLDLYQLKGECTIALAKQSLNPRLEVVVVEVVRAVSKNDKSYARVVVSDGSQAALLFIWENELNRIDPELLRPDVGIRFRADYDEARNSFSLRRGETLVKLRPKCSLKVETELLATVAG